MKKIVLFAANGFIGESIIDYTNEYQKDYQLVAVSRKPMLQLPEGIKNVLWDGKTTGPWAKELEGADLVINLAGKSVNCRYTAKNKAAIFASRLDSTRIIGEAIQDCEQKPVCWINVASATIYEHSLDHPNTEANGIIGKGFSVNVCKAWEKEFFAFKDLPTKQIALRSTIVLGKNGGVYPVLKKLARFGLGGKMGPGNQLISWIHIRDFCRALFFVAEKENPPAIYNFGSPDPVRNQVFQKELRDSLAIPYFINQPKWMLQLGVVFLGTETELILKSRYIFPENLLQEDFHFEFPTVRACLEELKH
ncbi:TIGR01777 family oxidoreductase [Fluviicola sp.]|uniref:TIGR01777 family oxidoreductase n=1 Tax=Fluviicola sp. TaxID=1917219 RepID=UPI0031CE53D1